MTIKKLREQTEMTQKDFAEYLNIPVRTLQDWEQERRTPPTYVIELIKYKLEKEKESMKKEGLRKKINRLIDRKMLETGKMGTEPVAVRLKLTETEKDEFVNIEWNKHYWWEFNEEELYISYSEEIE